MPTTSSVRNPFCLFTSFRFALHRWGLKQERPSRLSGKVFRFLRVSSALPGGYVGIIRTVSPSRRTLRSPNTEVPRFNALLLTTREFTVTQNPTPFLVGIARGLGLLTLALTIARGRWCRRRRWHRDVTSRASRLPIGNFEAMRHTVTLESDVESKIAEACRATGKAFDAVLNEVLRQGFAAKAAARLSPSLQIEPFDLEFRPGVSFVSISTLEASEVRCG